MGALTLKSFPFELRGWDIEKFESIDPTDSFGSNTRIYINKDQIIQIEPDYNIYNNNTWLTDKGRQFFDSIFINWNKKNTYTSKPLWFKLTKSIIQILYIFELCNTHKNNQKFFTIIFEHLSIETLSLLSAITQSQSFIKLRYIETKKTNIDLESNFMLNSATNKIKLNSSTLCLLIANNPRYEGYFLNLSLRQRILKGNFKCLMIGSLTNLTFPVSFLGSNLKLLKTIVEGNNLTCRDLKLSKNPLLLINSELFKRADGKNTLEMLKILKYAKIFNSTWNGINILNASLSETGIYSLNKFEPISLKDLNHFSGLYFLNVNKVTYLKKITEVKLFKTNATKQSFILNQNPQMVNTSFLKNSINKLSNYFFIPSNIFYENEESFINTEGFIKRTTKLIFKKQVRNNWQILRRIFKHLHVTKALTLNKKNNKIIFNFNKIKTFKNYIHFQYQTTQTLTNLSYYLNSKTKNFIILNNKFKIKRLKLNNTKLRYWLDDFFNGSKDEYSQDSLILTNCSKLLRSESTNFF